MDMSRAQLLLFPKLTHKLDRCNIVRPVTDIQRVIVKHCVHGDGPEWPELLTGNVELKKFERSFNIVLLANTSNS